MRISAVWYPVTDWHRARQFYGGVLGLQEVHRNDETGLTAYGTDNGPPLFLVHNPERAGKTGGAVVTFETEDIDRYRVRLLEAGVRVNPDITEAPTVRLLTFYDPDGNVVEASQPRRKREASGA
jgi:catechol 2,3-dioxygenase-like lactoylglutathione lyase family enzyme